VLKPAAQLAYLSAANFEAEAEEAVAIWRFKVGSLYVSIRFAVVVAIAAGYTRTTAGIVGFIRFIGFPIIAGRGGTTTDDEDTTECSAAG